MIRPPVARHAASPSLTVALLTALLAGCSGRTDVSARVHVDTLPGGIPRTISDQPVDSGRITLVRERDLQPPELDPAELLEPQDVAVADDGSVLVVDTKPTVIKVYGPDGRFLRSIGRSGSGPGEFRSAWIAVRGDTLVVQDPSNVRGTTFNWRTGALLAERRTACCYYHPIGIDGQGRAVAWAMVSPPDSTLRATQGVVRFAVTGDSADTVFVVGRQDVKSAPSWLVRNARGALYMSVAVPLQPHGLTAVDPMGRFVTGWSGEYLLRATSDGRDTTALFGRRFAPARVSAHQKALIVDQRIREVRGTAGVEEKALRAAFDPSQIPDVRPAFEALWIDRAGRRWVEESTGDSATVTLDVFAPDGRWLDVVSVPAGGWPASVYMPVAWSRDRAAVILDGDDGRPLVRVYRISVSR